MTASIAWQGLIQGFGEEIENTLREKKVLSSKEKNIKEKDQNQALENFRKCLQLYI